MAADPWISTDSFKEALIILDLHPHMWMGLVLKTRA